MGVESRRLVDTAKTSLSIPRLCLGLLSSTTGEFALSLG